MTAILTGLNSCILYSQHTTFIYLGHVALQPSISKTCALIMSSHFPLNDQKGRFVPLFLFHLYIIIAFRVYFKKKFTATVVSPHLNTGCDMISLM